MNFAVEVKDLSKIYRIGRLERETMLREKLVNLVKRPFGGRGAQTESIWALRDVSFGVEEGEVVGIIGRNENLREAFVLGQSCHR